ncbi:hypothetical protein PM10SUCC1_17370 [Propionigenium maris DSM 9537]|uniref:DUF3298 domain-containing protein n=1 Tax=Propionigenium maris DSM 9537 TaxID=1123000 RepID=A0A9W6LN50_9FUSO|nr:DUF3298 and DUF4163 domain-containing protein [Propionigenium maris]GLI56223.1 hypothetical protein PM10SUCC1_17370 [Propionigenium maris DSM 9537]
MKKILFCLCLILTTIVLGVEAEEKNFSYRDGNTIISGRVPVFKHRGQLLSEKAVDTFKILDEVVRMESRRHFRELGNKEGNPFVLKSDYSKVENKVGIDSYVVKTYYYAGREHGMVLETPYNFRKGREVTLGSLFKDEVNYRRLLRNKVEEIIIEGDPSMYYENIVVEEREFKFYFSEDNLVIIFNPYEIGPYESGILTFTIPLEELSDYLKD